MKSKIIVSAIIIFSISIQLKAQRAFEIGLKGGVNLAQLTTGSFYTTPFKDGKPWEYNGKILKDNLTQSLDTRQGYIGGVYARFGRKIFVQPEVYISTKGGTFDLTKVDIGALTPTSNLDDPNIKKLTNSYKVTFTNIDIPVLVGLRFAKIFRVNGGPVASLNVDSNKKINDALKDYTTAAIGDTFKKATFSYQLGGGLDLLKFGLDVRYEGSITEVSSVKLGDAVFAPKAKGWLVTLSYRLL